MTALITLTTAGTDSGPFNLYSNLDGYASAFEVAVPKVDLVAGYASSLVPDFTTTVRVLSTGVCTNYIDIVLAPLPTTTTTSSSSTSTSTSTSTTTTTTTTPTPGDCFCYTISNETAGTLLYSYTNCGSEFVRAPINADTISIVCSSTAVTGDPGLIITGGITSCTNSEDCAV